MVALLNELDHRAAKTHPDQSARDADLASHREAPATAVRKNRDPGSEHAAQEYRQYESQAMQLANAYRQQQATILQDAQKEKELKSELQGAVHAAFHARQAWQRAQAAQLRTRLEQIERRISERSQLSNEIIQRRVDELLQPEKQWESNEEGGSSGDSTAADASKNAAAESPAANQAGSTLPPGRQKAGNNNTASQPAAEATPDISVHLDPARQVANGSLPESAVDAPKYLLDAEAALESAKAKLTEAKSSYAWSEAEWKRSHELYEQGTLTEKSDRAAAADMEQKKRAVTQAEGRFELEEERQLQFDPTSASGRHEH